jgi:hypothetical protein
MKLFATMFFKFMIGFMAISSNVSKQSETKAGVTTANFNSFSGHLVYFTIGIWCGIYHQLNVIERFDCTYLQSKPVVWQLCFVSLVSVANSCAAEGECSKNRLFYNAIL